MTHIAISPRRAVLMFVVLPIAFFGAIALLVPQTRVHFSSEHKAGIASIANRLCSSVATDPCPIEWAGKHKWFGVLPRKGVLSVATLSQLRSALPNPEWSESKTTEEHVFTNGKYSVAYGLASGRITITSED